jgi:hypothetical protein
MSSPPRDYKAAYARRQERARTLGFRSYSQLRAAGGTAIARVNSLTAWKALPSVAQQSRDSALRVVSEMRATGLKLTLAANKHGVTPDEVRFWAGPALTSTTNQATARPADRLYRPMRLLTPDGTIAVDVRGSRVAATIGGYWNAVHHYLATGDTRPLQRYEGKRVGGVPLVTDPDVIEHVAHIGELSFESIYAAAA